MPSFGNSIGMDKGYDADGPLTKFRAVKVGVNTESVDVVTAATDLVFGVPQFTVTEDQLLRGKGASVRRAGITQWEAGGVITRGHPITIDAVGRCVDALTGVGAVAAHLNLGAANAELDLIAKVPGVAGNAITITLLDPGAASQVESVTVAGTDITVHLATSGASAITSTPLTIIQSLQANGDSDDLVTASHGAGTGASAVVAAAKTNLAGGVDATKEPAGTRVYGVADQAASALGVVIAVALELPGYVLS